MANTTATMTVRKKPMMVTALGVSPREPRKRAIGSINRALKDLARFVTMLAPGKKMT